MKNSVLLARIALSLLASNLATSALTAQSGESGTAAVSISSAAREIDRLLATELQAAGTRLRERTDDATFCRRTYLTVIGRIPTAQELDAFLAVPATLRRSQLIDRLIGSKGHVSHAFDQWADVLRIRAQLARQQSGEPFAAFVKQALADNMPYDEFVRRMLTASGPANARDNGATGYYLRDLGMPLDNMSNTMRVFLGTRMECAQCHDHPFDKWTQKQFYELAAFTGGMRFAADPSSGGVDVRRVLAQARSAQKDLGEDARRAVQLLTRQIGSGISGGGTAAIALPKDYKYDDAKPGAVVTAQVPFGQAAHLSQPHATRSGRAQPPRRPGAGQGQRERTAADSYADVDSRSAFADWVTSQDNPRFTKVIVNRIWKDTFGRGLVEPVDEFRDDTLPAHPTVLARLEELMKEFHYDMRALQRVLLSTELFGREAVIVPAESDAPFWFTGPVLRRLEAEQMWDSMLTLVVGDPDQGTAISGARVESIYRQYETVAAAAKDDVRALIERESLRYSDPAKYRRERAAEMMAAAPTTDAASSGEDLATTLRELTRSLLAARRARDGEKVKSLQAEIDKLRNGMQRDRVRRNPEVARASELQQPARPGHFLREFGQSDRDQIDSSTTDANVPQALRLMNGVVDSQLLANGSLLRQSLDAAGKPEERVRRAFRAILSREPRGEEIRTWKKDLEQDTQKATADLVWTLINCQEFRFVL